MLGGLERAPQAPQMFGVPRETRGTPLDCASPSRCSGSVAGPARAEGHAVAETVDALQSLEVSAGDLS
jgi:hypothetical protein